jgi:SAM-dependent methyltransferase
VGWWLDELTVAGHEHLDAGYVAGYEAKAQYDPSDDVAALLSNGVDASSTVLELGAGTGTFALAMAPHCAKVIAVDIAPPMVTAMRQRCPRNVEVVQAGFVTYEHDGPPVDAVFTRNALHQLPDFWKVVALSRIASCLRPRGTLRLRDLIYDCSPNEVDERIEAFVAGATTEDPRRGYTREELETHVRTEHSTFRWLFEPMLVRCGFDILDVQYQRAAFGAYTCRRVPD